MINSQLAMNAIERQINLAKMKNGKYLISKYLQSDCHYLTKALGEKLESENVILFYLSKSGRVIHSAIKYNNDNVLDILGERKKEEIIDFYDSHNDLFGLYKKEGYCTTMLVNINDFNCNDFYTENSYDKNKILEETKNWFTKILKRSSL